MNIDKYKEFPAAAAKILADHDAADLRVGDIFIGGTYSSDQRIVRISEIKYEKKSKTNDEDYVKIYYQRAKTWDASEWTGNEYCYIEEFTEKYQKITKSVEEHM